jgi:PKD repeat protein
MTSSSIRSWSWILLFVILLSGVSVLLSSSSEDTHVTATPFITQSTTQSGNRPPRAFSGGPYTGMEDSLLQFDGSASCDPDGIIVTYLWTFGDNTTATTPQPVQRYSQEGNYSITLTVIDDQGAIASQTSFASISDQSPLSDFTGSPLHGSAPLIVQFTDQSSSFDGINAWQWILDENVTSTAAHPHYTYTQSGLYSVTLTVTESDGDNHTVTKWNYINVSHPRDPLNHTVPTLITPLSPPIITAGTTLNQTLVLQNNDSSLLNRSTFHVSPIPLPNWTVAIEPATITLDPAANATVVLTVSPPSSTPPQQYNLSISVQNIDFPTFHTVRVLPVEVVAPPLEHAVPSVSISPFLQTGFNGSSIQYDILIRNNDAPSFPTTIFTLNTTLPAMWVSSSNQTAAILSPGESAVIALIITAPRIASPQNYTFMVTVMHGANASYDGQTRGLFTVIRENGDTPSDSEPTPPDTPLNVSVRIEPEMPTSNQTVSFTIQTNASTETETRIRIYVDEILIHQDTASGTYTYESGPFSAGPHTFHIEVENEDGVIIRIPINTTHTFIVTLSESSLPSFSWHGLLTAILPLLILNVVTYIIVPRRPS